MKSAYSKFLMGIGIFTFCTFTPAIAEDPDPAKKLKPNPELLEKFLNFSRKKGADGEGIELELEEVSTTEAHKTDPTQDPEHPLNINRQIDEMQRSQDQIKQIQDANQRQLDNLNRINDFNRQQRELRQMENFDRQQRQMKQIQDLNKLQRDY